jgi:hypothetical protein
MNKLTLVTAATLAGSAVLTFNASAQFATSVVDYQSGTGFATEFGTGAPYTDSSTALGAPATATTGEFGAPISPFNVPFEKEQIVSLGAGGSLTVQFANPIQNNAANPYGIDFLIFGSAGFIDADWPNGVSDGTGSIFGNNVSEVTRVYVGNSTDNMYLLNPSLAPIVDGMFPTDASGNFHLPVDPSFNNASFANRTMAEMSAMYGGSAGGTGFDLAWAVDGLNNPVALDNIQFIRVDVLSGRSEIDAFSAVMVPEPSTIVLAALGSSLLLIARRNRRG